MAKYYKPSGKYSPTAFVNIIIASVTVIPILSFLYALSCAEVPYIILKWAFPIIFALLAGAVCNYCIVMRGKTQSWKIATAIGFVVGIWFYFLHWVFFFVYVSGQKVSVNFTALISKEGNDFFSQSLYLIKNPLLVFELIKKYSAVGMWSFFDISWNGGLLAFSLIIEFMVILLIIVFLAYVGYDKPFSEEDNVWYKEELVKVPNYYFPEDNFVQKLESGDYKDLFKIPSKITDQAEFEALNTKLSYGYAQYILYSHRNTYYLSASNMRRKFNDKGKISYSDENLLNFIQITPDFALKIRELKKEDFTPSTEINNYNQYNLNP